MILLQLIGLGVLIALLPYILTAGLYIGGALLILGWTLVTWLFTVPAMLFAAVFLSLFGHKDLAWAALYAGIPISILVKMIDLKLMASGWGVSQPETTADPANASNASSATEVPQAKEPKRRRPIAPPF
jgi:hypothetical protein